MSENQKKLFKNVLFFPVSADKPGEFQFISEGEDLLPKPVKDRLTAFAILDRMYREHMISELTYQMVRDDIDQTFDDMKAKDGAEPFAELKFVCSKSGSKGVFLVATGDKIGVAILNRTFATKVIENTAKTGTISPDSVEGLKAQINAVFDQIKAEDQKMGRKPEVSFVRCSCGEHGYFVRDGLPVSREIVYKNKAIWVLNDNVQSNTATESEITSLTAEINEVFTAIEKDGLLTPEPVYHFAGSPNERFIVLMQDGKGFGEPIPDEETAKQVVNIGIDSSAFTPEQGEKLKQQASALFAAIRAERTVYFRISGSGKSGEFVDAKSNQTFVMDGLAAQSFLDRRAALKVMPRLEKVVGPLDMRWIAEEIEEAFDRIDQNREYTRFEQALSGMGVIAVLE